MTTRLKTVQFAHPATAAMTDNTLTTMTQITVYIPETAGGKTVTFRSVIAYVTADNTETATGNVTTRQLQCRLAAVAYVAHTNSNLYTGSGEDLATFHCVDLTAHFAANWSGTSMTFDSQVLMDGTQTTPAWTNVCVTLQITYEYDDTATTQIKTVLIPLDAPVGLLATSKPGAATATIPLLDTHLPETSKVYRSRHIIIQGNDQHNAATTDTTISAQLDATTALTTGVHEGAAASDVWRRYVWDVSAVLNTAASMGFYLWANTAKYNHLQAWLVVTYEFDATASTDCFVSLLLPANIKTPTMGGLTSSDYQRIRNELWIEEGATIATKQIAFYGFWSPNGATAGLNMRVGTGSFVTYTDNCANPCGGNGAMCRNDAAFTLARGKNTLTFDIYRTTANQGQSFGGFWIVNYTCAKPTNGYGAANHTVRWNLGATFDGVATAIDRILAAVSPTIPEASFFLNGIGYRWEFVSNTTGFPTGAVLSVERLSAEGGVLWENVWSSASNSGGESGLRCHFGGALTSALFDRWASDPDADRIDPETARRWWLLFGDGVGELTYLDLIFSYHTITFTVGGTVSGSGGGTVTARACRDSDGEILTSTTRSGNGAVSLTWYDNTENVFVDYREDATHLGRSERALASGTP